jgi:hypothetical protein
MWFKDKGLAKGVIYMQTFKILFNYCLNDNSRVGRIKNTELASSL